MGNSLYAIYETPVGTIGIFIPNGFLDELGLEKLKYSFLNKMTEIDEDFSTLDDEHFEDWVFAVTNPDLDKENTPRISNLNFRDAAYVYNVCKVMSHNNDYGAGLRIYYLHNALATYFKDVQGTYDENFPELDLQL